MGVKCSHWISLNSMVELLLIDVFFVKRMRIRASANSLQESWDALGLFFFLLL